MGMDMSSGVIRSLSSKEDLKETEVLFELGEEVELKGCKFDVIAVYPEPANEVVLKGKAQSLFDKFKEEGAIKTIEEKLKEEAKKFRQEES
jgi:hypothetical protein